ncbi:MAG: uracil-DNA glycosylase [Planctomycetaceae bacterium]
MDTSDVDVARRILLQRLESLARAGVAQLGKPSLDSLEPLWTATQVGGQVEAPPARAAVPNAPAAAAPRPAPAMPAAGSEIVSTSASLPSTTSYPGRESAMARSKVVVGPAPDSLLHQPFGAKVPVAERQLELVNMAQLVDGCQLCKELACSRGKTVFGVGRIQPRVVFFGEAPGADEDRVGEPFVGRAGQLLTKIIEACGWTREDVYIMNVLKCRPPDNRTPLPDEVRNCRPFFERQLELLHPEYIVCVGTTPTQALLETNETIGKMRKRFHDYRGIKVVATYHPSYLLRNPDAKKYVWEDMLMLLADMGLSPPKRS